MFAIEVQAQAVARQQEMNRRFRWALFRGRWRMLWSRLSGKSAQLLDLNQVLRQQGVREVRSTGNQTVTLAHICGTDGRSNDFDSAFFPRQTHTRERWLRVARARLEGIELGPVDLIQVGERYFVRDGHHRISVANAFGQHEIDAVVTVWKTDAPALAPDIPAQERVGTAQHGLRLFGQTGWSWRAREASASGQAGSAWRSGAGCPMCSC